MAKYEANSLEMSVGLSYITFPIFNFSMTQVLFVFFT